MTHEFKTEKGEFLAVKVPELFNDPFFSVDAYGTYLTWPKYGLNPENELTDDEHGEIKLPIGNYDLICTTKDATEEQAKEIVDIKFVGYGEYTALEILSLLLESEKLYRVNPFEKPEDDDYSFYTDRNVSVKEEWQQAEERAGNWAILKKKQNVN